MKSRIKESFWTLLGELLQAVFHSKQYAALRAALTTTTLPPRHALCLSYRKEAIDALTDPSAYYECKCCKDR